MADEKRIRSLLSQLTLEEKISLCYGDGKTGNHDVPRLGIRKITMNDGPRGIRLEDGRKSTALPCGISIACSFSRKAAFEYGKVLGEETGAAGYQAILGPGLNIMRSPLCGRNFEYSGEDPVLAGEISAAYIQGVQSTGVAACPKHYALNNQETCRRLSSANATERTIRELYLRGFEICTRKAEPWMLMSSYNRVNGTYVSEHRHLQQEILKDEWGFDGVVVSDWGSTHSAYRAAFGGLDLEMSGGEGAWFNKPLRKLVKEGFIPESVIDDKALRILRLLDRVGCLDEAVADEQEISTAEHRRIARELAAEGTVLLQNNGILPLDKKKLKKIAVIGPSADFCHDIGTLYMCGGSGAVHPEYEITPLAGLREYLGNEVEVVFAAGEDFTHTRTISGDLLRTADGRPGLNIDYYAESAQLDDPEARPIISQVDTKLDYVWGNMSAWVALEKEKSPLDKLAFGVRMKGFIVPDKTGTASIGLYQAGTCDAKIRFNGKIVVDNQVVGYQNGMSLYTFDTVAGEAIEVEITCKRRWSTSQLGFRVIYLADRGMALDAAKDADAVLYFGGTNHLYDKEALGFTEPDTYADLPDLNMPGNQDELISELLKVNPNTVVTLIGGSVINVGKWADKAPAVVMAWYGGMEAGRAIADVLFGEREPGGRLCCSWLDELANYPCHKYQLFPGCTDPYNSFSDYLEEVFVGYRGIPADKVRYPFGHGLSYTAFAREIVSVKCDGRNVTAVLKITNTGNRKGSDVIQLYVHDCESSLARPVLELQNFEKVTLAPGESREISLQLGERDFSYFNESGEMIFEAGDFELHFGTSSQNIFAVEKITLQ